MQQLVIEGRTWLDFSMLAIKLSTGHVINANLKNCFFSLPLSVSLQIKAEVTEDVYTSRKKQHQTMMHYFCALNTLQYKKKISLLEPLLGYMQAQVISDSESCRGQRRNKSPSWRLMYWNPLQALFSSPRKEMEKKNHPSTSVGCPSCALMCWQLALLIAHPLQGSFMRGLHCHLRVF